MSPILCRFYFHIPYIDDENQNITIKPQVKTRFYKWL